MGQYSLAVKSVPDLFDLNSHLSVCVHTDVRMYLSVYIAWANGSQVRRVYQVHSVFIHAVSASASLLCSFWSRYNLHMH